MDKPVSECTEEELIQQLSELRDRRAKARERKAPAPNGIRAKMPRKQPSELSAEEADILKDILGP